MFRQLLTRAVLAAAALTPAACLEVPQPPPKDALAVRDVETSEGMKLESTCVPTGMEMCFDALDNNCNGIIDEGCGVNTGMLQFAIAWQEADADVDLHVTGPSGDEASKDKPSDDGLQLDRDCGQAEDTCFGQNMENVYLAEGPPRRGRYRVKVKLEDLHDAEPPIRVRLSARLGQRHYTSSVVLRKQHDEREIEFTL